MFEEIPTPVISFVRKVFRRANLNVSSALFSHPSTHEEMLDHQVVMSVAASPATYFSHENIAVDIETHWLGGRRQFGRWEIADIAFFVLLRKRGVLIARKVALLQTKRLYSKEIPVVELEKEDYQIGIGRLVDRTDPEIPLSRQRSFSFSDESLYGAMAASSDQVSNITEYMKSRRIPVYYGFYNPPSIPSAGLFPATAHPPRISRAEVGCRVLPAEDVHAVLSTLPNGQAPSFKEMTLKKRLRARDAQSNHGWRLENFVADEVLRCRQGKIFERNDDDNLEALLYRRSAPIASAISITIDIGGEKVLRKMPMRVRRRPRII